MIIEGEFYRLTPISEHSSKYDLELLYDIKGKNPRKEYKIASYGIPIEIAIKRIITYAVNKKFDNEVITLKEFLSEYKEETDKIRKEFADFI